MPASNAPLIMPQDGSAQRHQPQVFSDEELSEIFQIDFGEIFGSVDEGAKPSKYSSTTNIATLCYIKSSLSFS